LSEEPGRTKLQTKKKQNYHRKKLHPKQDTLRRGGKKTEKAGRLETLLPYAQWAAQVLGEGATGRGHWFCAKEREMKKGERRDLFWADGTETKQTRGKTGKREDWGGWKKG